MSGPYNMKSNETTMNFLTEWVGVNYEQNKYKIMSQKLTNFVKPTIITLIIQSFLYYYSNSTLLSSYINSKFHAMNCP